MHKRNIKTPITTIILLIICIVLTSLLSLRLNQNETNDIYVCDVIYMPYMIGKTDICVTITNKSAEIGNIVTDNFFEILSLEHKKLLSQAHCVSNTIFQNQKCKMREDENYKEYVIKLSEEQYKAVSGLIMGEMGSEGFDGCCIMAQAIKDGMKEIGCYDVFAFKKIMGYTANISQSPNQDSIDAVNYIFRQGKYAVKHRILYMYSTRYTYSKWHESQNFIIEYNNVRFFDKCV